MTDFAQKLSVLRRMLGKPQKAIGLDVKVRQETVSSWELGKKPIPDKRVDALARSWGCEPNDFRSLALADLVVKVSEQFRPPLFD